ncbi:hypothetical protein [Arsukibacterium sp.]|uniref:hypothetical protein n=1 Tax=Arsukibacterium sp. TaxID=1977258 RepID=UPI00299CDFC3|nr:hypothetical protein [Arsukibacterium sp.]MDX1538015.1 hypothetical protein [Arsukibacterium sp.]
MKTEEIPNIVKLFLYPMHGIIENKNISFLTPKRVSESKKNLSFLKSQCEAIVWVLEHKSFDYSSWTAKYCTTQQVVDFAESNAIIFLHEGLFKLCGVKFDENLLSSDLCREDVLRFYVDYPSSMQIIKHLYKDYLKKPESKYTLNGLIPQLAVVVEENVFEILAAIHSISHFEARDYAIALQDYDNPERAEAFFMALKQTLNDIALGKE